MRMVAKVVGGAIAAAVAGVGGYSVARTLDEPQAVVVIKATRPAVYPGETVSLTAQGLRDGQKVNGTVTWDSYDSRNIRVLRPTSGVLYALRPGLVAVQAVWISTDKKDTICATRQMLIRDRRGVHSGNAKPDTATYNHTCGTAPTRFVVPTPVRMDTVRKDSMPNFPCAYTAYGVPARISPTMDTAFFIGKPTYNNDAFPHEKLGVYCVPYNMTVHIETDSGRGRFGVAIYPATPKFEAPGYRARDF